MNNYPEWWDQTITVYNKYENGAHQISWQRTVLTGCFWKNSDTLVYAAARSIESNTTLCRIPINKKFIEKHHWDNLSTAARSTHFTLGVGDFIVRGAVNDTVDEYQSGQRSSDIIAKYKGAQMCFVIQRCSINVGGGRGMEHYYVRGV